MATEPQNMAPEEVTEGPSLSPAKKLVFALVAAVLCVLGLEGIGRLAGLPSGTMRTLSKIGIGDQETFDACLGMWRPGFRGRVAWPISVAYDVEINSLGFRGAELPREKTSGRTRVLCLGDSTTFGSHVDNDATYPALLEAELRARGHDVELINAGHPAWSTADELRYLEERGLAAKPDIVLHLFCDNDPAGIVDERGLGGEYDRKLSRIHSGQSLAELLRFHTAIGELETRLHIAFKKWRGKKRSHDLGAAHIDEPQWQRYSKVYGRLAELCGERDIKLVSAAFPQIEEHSDPSQRAENRVAAIARDHKIPFVTLAPAFREAESRGDKLYNLPEDSHANPRGNRIIARLLADGLERSALKTP